MTGGLHQRPEYNVALSVRRSTWRSYRRKSGRTANCLRSRFPRTTAVQHRFLSRKVAVEVDGSQIEIALDQGEVKAVNLLNLSASWNWNCLAATRAGAETGEPTGIANRITPGQPDKAARGYHLAQGNPAREIKPTPFCMLRQKLMWNRGWKRRSAGVSAMAVS